MTKIIISYRRQDSEAITGRIRDRLANQYGNDSIFMDIDSIPLGVDFRDHIGEALRETDILIAVIGPKWLGTQKGGRTRIREESDPVRVEVEKALERGIIVIPVLVNNATMPKSSELPDRLVELSYRNAATVDSGRDFHQHVDRLIRSIDQILSNRAKQNATGASNADAGANAALASNASPAIQPDTPASGTTTAASLVAEGARQSTAAVASSSPKRWLAGIACVLLCAIAAGGTYLYRKGPSNPVPNDEAVKSAGKQIDGPAKPQLSVTPVFDTGCKPEDGPAFFDNFKSPDGGWGPTDAEYYFRDGQMVLKPEKNTVEKRIYRSLLFAKATICGEITSPSELKQADGVASAGLMFWAINYQNFYTSVIYPNGTYAIFRNVDGAWTTVVPRVKADAIRSGPNTNNQMKITTGDNAATLFINGIKIADIWGQPAPRGGSAGFYAESESEAPNEWKFSSIAVAGIGDAAAPSAKALVPARDDALLHSCRPNASVAFFDNFNPYNSGWTNPVGSKGGGPNFKPAPKTSQQMLLPALIFKAGTFCADIKFTSEPAGASGNFAKLIFWALDYRNYYAASIYADGTYDVYRMIDGRFAGVRPRAKATSIGLGTGAVNHTKISFNNEIATLIINDVNVVQFRGQPSASGGFIGIGAESEGGGGDWTFLNTVVMLDEDKAAALNPPDNKITGSGVCEPSATSGAFLDDFKSPDPGWEAPSANRKFENSQMVLNPNLSGSTAWIYSPLIFKNTIACSDVFLPSKLETVSGIAAGGIVFWAADYQNYYVAEIFGDATFAVYRIRAGKWTMLYGRTKDDSIRQGAGAVNHLMVKTADNYVNFFVNDKKIAYLWGQSPSRGGATGLFAQSEDGKSDEWRFSKIVALEDKRAKTDYPEGANTISSQCGGDASLAFFENFNPLDPGWGTLPSMYSIKDGSLSVRPAENSAQPRIYFPLVFTGATACSEIKSPPHMDKPDDAGSAGIIFWAVDYQNYWTATIFPTGKYGVSRKIDGEWATVVPPTAADKINHGPDAINRMKVKVDPNGTTIFINDVIVTNFRGQPPAGGTAFGLFAESGTYEEDLWRFTNMAILN
jgi:hypothetical protein